MPSLFFFIVDIRLRQELRKWRGEKDENSTVVGDDRASDDFPYSIAVARDDVFA